MAFHSSKCDLRWGVKAISEEIGRTERQTYHLLALGELPAKKVGGRWVASAARLRAALIGDGDATAADECA